MRRCRQAVVEMLAIHLLEKIANIGVCARFRAVLEPVNKGSNIFMAISQFYIWFDILLSFVPERPKRVLVQLGSS